MHIMRVPYSIALHPIIHSCIIFAHSKKTGIIVGTPLTLSEAVKVYSITATNSGGTSAVFAIIISVVDRVPIISSYTNATAVYTINAPIYNNTPTMSTAGGTPTTFSINPGIPPALGLRWDSVR